MMLRVHPLEKSFLTDEKLREILDHLVQLSSNVFAETVILKEDPGMIAVSMNALKSVIVYFSCKANKEFLESLEVLKGKPTTIVITPRHQLILLSLGIKMTGLTVPPSAMVSTVESRNYFFKYVLTMNNNIDPSCQVANEADLHRTWIQLETTLSMSPAYKEIAYYYYKWFSENKWPEVINDHHMDEFASIAGIDKKWPLLKEMEAYKGEEGEASKWKLKAEQSEKERVKLISQVNELMTKMTTIEKAVKSQKVEIEKSSKISEMPGYINPKAQEASGAINRAVTELLDVISDKVKKDAEEIKKIQEEVDGAKKIALSKGDKLTALQLAKISIKLETKAEEVKEVGENLEGVVDISNIAQLDKEFMTDPARQSIGIPPSLRYIEVKEKPAPPSGVKKVTKPALPSGTVALPKMVPEAPPAPPSGIKESIGRLAHIVAKSLSDLPTENRRLSELLKSKAGKLKKRPASLTGTPVIEEENLQIQLANKIAALKPFLETSESESESHKFSFEDGHSSGSSFGSLAKAMTFDDGEEDEIDSSIHSGATKWPDIVNSFGKESEDARKRSFENIHNYG